MSIRVSELVARLDDKFSSGARAIAQNADGMATAVAEADAAGQSLTSTFRKTGQTLDQFSQSTDGVEKAQARLDKAYDRFSQKVTRAREELEKGTISQQKYNDILGTQANLYEKIEARETRNIETIRAKAEAVTALAQAQAKASQEHYNDLMGVSATSASGADRYSDLISAFDDADRVRAKLVPLAAAEQDYAKSVEEASSALSAGIITQKEYDAYVGKASNTLGRQKAALGGNAAAVKLTSFEMGILADETHKFFDQVLAGGNPLQAAFYQVPNMVQVMGGLDGALSRVGAALSGPGGIAAAAALAGAAIYKVGAYAEGEQEQLAQLSQRLRATRTDYADMAQQAEEAARTLKGNSDLSLGDSRTVVQTIVAVPTVDASQITRYTADVRDMATVMGTTATDAAKTMASALNDPARAAEDFAQKGLPGFNAGLVLMVQHMQQVGDRAGATEAVIKGWEQATKGAADQGLTPLQQAWKKLGDDLGGPEEKIRQVAQGVGDFFVAMGTTALNVVDEVITGFKKIPDEIASVGNALWGGLKSAGSYLENGVESGLNAVGATNMAGLMHQGNAANPTFSAPDTGASSAAASAASAVTAAQDKQKQSTSDLTTHYAELEKVVNAAAGADGSLSGQIADQQRKIQGLNRAIADENELFKAGKHDASTHAALIENFKGQLQAANVALAGMRGPFADLIEQQDRAAQSASALTGYDKAMVEASQQADDAARSLSGGMASAAEKALVQSAAARTLANEYQTGTDVMQRNTALQRQVSDAWLQGGQAATEATAYVQAYTEALGHYKEGTPAFVAAVQQRKAALLDAAHVASDSSLNQQTLTNNDQLAVLQAQTASIGKNDDARQLMVAHMQAEQQVLRGGTSLTDESAQAYLKSADAVSEATIAYQHQQQVLDDVTGSLSDMADQLSDGITQGFLQGTSSGMSFKSTLQGVETQIASLIVRMTMINPLLNSIDGQSRSTLSDVFSLLSSTGAGSSGGSSVESFSGSGIELSPGEAQSFKNSLSGGGISGIASAASDAGSIGSSSSGLSNLFSGKAADGSGIFSSFGSALSSIGSYMGIAGAAVGVGTMAYSLLKGLFSKTHYVWDNVSAQDGHLYISGQNAHRATNYVTGELNPQLSAINNLMDMNNVEFEDGYLGNVGYYHHGKHYSSSSLSDIITNGKLTSSDANMAEALKDIMPSSVSSISEWEQDVESIKSIADAMDAMKVSIKTFDDSTHVTVDHFNGYTGDMATALSTLDGKTLSTSDLQSQFEAIEEFVGTTMPGLLRVTAEGSESLMDQVDDLKQKYQDAATTAQSYGLDAQALLDKGNAIAAKMIADENTSLAQSDLSVQARYMAATGDQEGADLLNQQVSGDQAIAQLQESWRSYLGDTYADNATYQQQMTDLEKTLAAERLEIQQQYAGDSLDQLKQYNSSALQSVTSVFSSLNSYVQDLETSDASPLSVQDQYGAANDNLTSDYQKAMGGDYDALSRVQSDAQTYLSLAQQWDGSGTAYADDFQKVLTMLQSLGNLGADTFTASLAKTLFQQNTDATLQVKTAIQNMQTAITAELRQFTRVQAAKAA
ncbi:phage tail length tape measure family protein [Acetobacter ghanensis]|uniref:phage tail length tape measure family protein n=1 Tax=Acetobacter ghanensis TaxID=431306 RepID=UPI003D33313F